MSRCKWQNHEGENRVDRFELKELFMNIEKVFAKVLKAKSKNKDVSVITNFSNTNKLLKLLFVLPDTQIATVKIAEPKWCGCYDLFLLSTGGDGRLFCEPVIKKNGDIIKGSGIYLIDKVVLGEYKPEDFILDGDDVSIKLIGGD